MRKSSSAFIGAILLLWLPGISDVKASQDEAMKSAIQALAQIPSSTTEEEIRTLSLRLESVVASEVAALRGLSSQELTIRGQTLGARLARRAVQANALFDELSNKSSAGTALMDLELGRILELGKLSEALAHDIALARAIPRALSGQFSETSQIKLLPNSLVIALLHMSSLIYAVSGNLREATSGSDGLDSPQGWVAIFSAITTVMAFSAFGKKSLEGKTHALDRFSLGGLFSGLRGPLEGIVSVAFLATAIWAGHDVSPIQGGLAGFTILVSALGAIAFQSTYNDRTLRDKTSITSMPWPKLPWSRIAPGAQSFLEGFVSSVRYVPEKTGALASLPNRGITRWSHLREFEDWLDEATGRVIQYQSMSALCLSGSSFAPSIPTLESGSSVVKP